ncbi:hypothetical protein Emag_002515 [Eimeria magna]
MLFWRPLSAQLNCEDSSSFYAAEAALLRDRRQTLQQLQPKHIRDLRRAYEALGVAAAFATAAAAAAARVAADAEGGQETWGELLHFLSRVEEALNKAGAGPLKQESNTYDQQQQQQQEKEQQQEREQQQHTHVVAHTYVSGSGHRAEPVLLRRGLKSPA